MKHCQLGDHLVSVLWRAKGKTQLSGCKDCCGKERAKDTTQKPVSFTSNSTAKKVEKVYSTSSSSSKRPAVSQKKLNNLDEVSTNELVKLAVIVVHKAVKERDRKGDYFRCIACDEVKHISVAQAGHFRPSTCTPLKLNLFNINLECEQCNCHDPNHLVGYRKNLIKKIGFDEVLRLEEVPTAQFWRWDREELYQIINENK